MRKAFAITARCPQSPSCFSTPVDRLNSRLAARMHPLPELLSLRRSHLVIALGHAPPPIPAARPSMPAKTAKQDPAQNQQSECLREADGMPAKNGGRQPVPQLHHDQSKYPYRDHSERGEFQSSCEPSAFHIEFYRL